MKFACIMVTRGRPLTALASIEIAKSLSSGKHELSFIVCCDDDDKETQERLSDYPLSVAPAPFAMGELWNRGASEIPDADVFCPIVDDSFIAVEDWSIIYLTPQPPKDRF